MADMGDKCSCGRRKLAGECPFCGEKAKATRERKRIEKAEKVDKDKPSLRKGIAEEIFEEPDEDDFFGE